MEQDPAQWPLRRLELEKARKAFDQALKMKNPFSRTVDVVKNRAAVHFLNKNRPRRVSLPTTFAAQFSKKWPS